MVLDTSALVAILLREKEWRVFAEAMEQADRRALSMANLVETAIVLETRHGADGVRSLDLLVAKAAIEPVPVDLVQAQLAREAYRRFGKGRHPAALNFGDCFAYALSQAYAEPLLFKGGDFGQTDVECHPASARPVSP